MCAWPGCKKWELGPRKRAPLLTRSCRVEAAEDEAHGGEARGRVKVGLIQARLVGSPEEDLQAPRTSQSLLLSSPATTGMRCGRMYWRWPEGATSERAWPPSLGGDREACA